MNIDEWFNRPLEVDTTEPDDEDNYECETLFDRFAFLIARNGGMEVHGWGSTSVLSGLNQDQALELIHYAGIFEGFASAFEGMVDLFLERLINRAMEIRREVEERENAKLANQNQN